ncbi:DEAD/DEAH box helicase [Oceanococcus atlanticus]|uniref:DEAD-box ATP-dependent RNA helicase RhpA n=1 Tax=Oceanococcus atlanticus TaxID=1317117 RepID=A0A1Y1SGX4_9GAMM|nr:DEAD/DEAH box helicase [Oceanococcus atlanticus]ORE88923.1 DEAD/DEAH box helicase [Oceanococcus atlanticus]
MNFQSLELNSQLQDALARAAYTQPTPIQAQAIPAVLSGRDVLAAAQTGTGKTAAFTLPILERLSRRQDRATRARVLILAPTRELAAQIGASIETYGASLPHRAVVIFGGVSAHAQIKNLRKRHDIIVATPGRLLDLAGSGDLSLADIDTLVLDEADRMLDMGFIHDIKRVLKLLPPQRQNLMFSATFSPEIRQLAQRIVNDPVEIDVAPRNSAAQTVKQHKIRVPKDQKRELLAWMIERNDWYQVLVFARTKHGANRLCKQLEAEGLSAAAIHGNKSQNARTQALAGFKARKIRVLVATDIAARGIDISELPHVINYELPMVAEDYVHRIGRTGRAGCEGEALSLYCGEELKQLKAIEKLLGRDIPVLQIDDYLIREDRSTPADAPKPQRGRQAPGGGGGRNKGQGGQPGARKSADGAAPAGQRRRRRRGGGGGGAGSGPNAQNRSNGANKPRRPR